MGRIKSLILIPLLLILLFCSCDDVPYFGQRPVDYPQSRWVCKEYNISFSVGENGELIDATMEIKDDLIPFKFAWMAFDNSVNLYFEIDGKSVELSGKCNYGSEVFSIFIADTKGYYPTEEVTLEFVRVEE